MFNAAAVDLMRS